MAISNTVIINTVGGDDDDGGSSCLIVGGTIANATITVGPGESVVYIGDFEDEAAQ